MSQTTESEIRTTQWNMASPLHLLLIEHAQADAELNLHELERAGFQCAPRIVATRSDFLEYLRRFPFDVVLSEYHLPGWTGMDAFNTMRESGHDVPFILVTGTLGEELVVDCIKQGVTDYVLKGHVARLPGVVSRALEERALRAARKFMAGAWRQSESNPLFLFANNPLPMWVFDWENLSILEVNDAALRHYGYERINFLEMSAKGLHPLEEIPEFLAKLQNIRPDSLQSGQWHHRRKDGSLIDVEMYLHRMDYSGSPAALVVALDITERKRTEEERQKFFTLVENSRDFIAVADLGGNVEYVNPAGRTLLGVSDQAAQEGSRTVDYVAADDLPLIRETVYRAVQKDGHWQGEIRFRHQETGQSIAMDSVVFLVRDPQTGKPRFVATVSRDITERRALEQQLRHAQKFEAIGQLAGGIAHDFNNVIGAILGWAELGEEQSSSVNVALEAYFKKIHAQCDRVSALIRQLLAFARRQILEPRSLSLNQTVQEVLNLLDKVIGKNIEIRTCLAGDLSAVRADPTQIEQVLMNLCINSRDAMSQGGTLTISTGNAQFSPDDCRKGAGFKPGDFAELRVADTGIGMDATVRERIFEPFFTTKGPGQGTGLGLATVYGIVEQHGGFIHVESTPGHGSTFRVFLPVIEANEAREIKPPVQSEASFRGGNETILIAEDHEGLREVASAALRAKGYRVLLARDGQEAVDMFTRSRDEISLIVMDVVMPKRSGLQAYEAIKDIRGNVPVLFVTGYSNEAASLRGILERGVTVIQKPYSPVALCRKVRETLDSTDPKASIAEVKTTGGVEKFRG